MEQLLSGFIGKRFVQWFHDAWDHWEAVVTEYENSEVF